MPLGKDCKSKWTQSRPTATCPSPTAHGIRFLSDWEIFDTSLNYAMKALKPMVHWCHPVIAYLWCHRQRCTQGSGSGSEDKFNRFILIIDAPMIPIGCFLLNNNKQIQSYWNRCHMSLELRYLPDWLGWQQQQQLRYLPDYVDKNSNNKNSEYLPDLLGWEDDYFCWSWISDLESCSRKNRSTSKIRAALGHQPLPLSRNDQGIMVVSKLNIKKYIKKKSFQRGWLLSWHP